MVVNDIFFNYYKFDVGCIGGFLIVCVYIGWLWMKIELYIFGKF